LEIAILTVQILLLAKTAVGVIFKCFIGTGLAHKTNKLKQNWGRGNAGKKPS
jgi:hypothetical protein